MRRTIVLAIALVIASSCARAAGQEREIGDHHCLGERRPKWVLHHLLAAQYNPPGAETSERLGLCVPLVTAPGVLFVFTHVEVGLASYLSPAYGQLGGYVQITPLSILQLRAELTGLQYWPFPFDRAGYFELSGYDALFTRERLPREQAGSAPGWNLNLIAILRARVRLDDTLGLVLLSMWAAEHFSIGDAPYYFNLRRELAVARSDWIVTNESVVALELPMSPEWRARFGLYESWRTVPASGYVANQLGLFVGAEWPRPTGLLSSMRDLQPFLRLGGYTAHRFRRAKMTVLLGVLSSYDLGPL